MTTPRTIVRGYAAPASADVKPPVALFGVDGTYASALVCSVEVAKSTQATEIADSIKPSFVN